ADVIHLHGQEFITSLFGFCAARTARIPCVLTLHSNGYALDHMWITRTLRRGLYRSLFKVMINHSDIVVLPTREARHVVQRYGLTPRSTVHIPLAVDLARFRDIEQRQDYVLYLGRLNPTKRPEWLVKAAPLILKEVDTRFIIAGDGFQRPYLERLASELAVCSKIKFLGSVPYEKVPELMGRASVFVAPGGAGYTLLEAGALGKPIVSAKLEWNISCIGEEGAYYVEPRDERGLAEAVVRVLRDHDLSKRISASAMNFVHSTRSWHTTTKRYVSLYKSLRKAGE
ncbi:MAG: glycosyltransferase family 4 protein, partial [Candidatus Bathyarchaeia archaeon]